MSIHPTAIVSKKAKIADSVSIGPYSCVSDNVSIGAGTVIGAHCVIDGHTTIGANCEIFTGAVLGSKPQDLKFKAGSTTYLKIGDSNVIREYCTFNPGTDEGSSTVVGDNNLFMAYSHVAHDCLVGSGCVLANNGTLAGHVTIEDKVIIGGLAAVHQFVTVGTLAIIGGCSKAAQDIPPFTMVDGHPARVYTLNLTGLRRNKITPDSIRKLRHAFSLLFNSGLTISRAVEKLEKELRPEGEVKYLVEFVRRSQRGVARSCRSHNNRCKEEHLSSAE